MRILLVYFVLAILFTQCGYYFANWLGEGGAFEDNFTPGGMQELIYACVFAPLWEELYFRYVPIKVGNAIKVDDLTVLIFSSIWFALSHEGTLSIPIQGMLGIFLFLTFKKYGYWAAVAFHSLYNLLCLTIL